MNARNARGAVLAAAAAALFTAGIAAHASADHHEKGDKVQCDGVNKCKGQSECATASNECSGQNSCKGKGWKSMTQEECDKAKESMKES